MTRPFPIFMYHGLWPAIDDEQALAAHFASDPQLSDPGARLYALDERIFERQLEAITQAGVVGDRLSSLNDPEASPNAWITFDDGHVSNCTIALPRLKRHGLTAVFFITTDWIGRPGFMSETQIRQLHEAGMIIGGHGCSHRYLSDLTAKEIRTELENSKRRLEEIIQAPVCSVSLPGGRNHPVARDIARELGYEHVFTSRWALAEPSGDPFDWPRVAITNRQSPQFLHELLAGNTTLLDKLARRARMRENVRKVLGNRFYDGVRSLLIRK